MTHDHSHAHDHDHDADETPTRLLAAALVINTLFFFVELGGAYYANSLTLLADALHMLTDSISLILALLAAWLATRPADRVRSYGYNRAEVLAGFLNGVFLLGVAGFVVFDAFRRLQNPSMVDAELVIVIGIIGLVANTAAAYLLIDDRENLNVEGAFLHLAIDAVSSLAVVIGGVVMLVTGSVIVDPILALLIAVLVLYSVTDLLRDSVNILLQGTPSGVDLEQIMDELKAVDGVVGTHHVHVWALDSRTTALSAHIVIGEDENPNDVFANVREKVASEFDVEHVTIQVEQGNECSVTGIDCY